MVARLAGQGIETSDDWIVERTGIRARHFAAAGVNSSDLAAEACRRALEAARLKPEDIDLIIVATSTPDMVFPSTACILQNKLGANGCPAFDVQAVCSGFVYALSVADAMIQNASASKALVVGAEVFSRILISRIEPPVCCLATEPAPWSWRPRIGPVFWPLICTPMAAMWTSYAPQVMSPRAAC